MKSNEIQWNQMKSRKKWKAMIQIVIGGCKCVVVSHSYSRIGRICWMERLLWLAGRRHCGESTWRWPWIAAEEEAATGRGMDQKSPIPKNKKIQNQASNQFDTVIGGCGWLESWGQHDSIHRLKPKLFINFQCLDWNRVHSSWNVEHIQSKIAALSHRLEIFIISRNAKPSWLGLSSSNIYKRWALIA